MQQKTSFIQRLIDKITPASVTTYTRSEQPKNNQISPDALKYLASVGAIETQGLGVGPDGVVTAPRDMKKGVTYRPATDTERYGYSKFSGDQNLGRDLGLYQVTEGTLKTYGPRFLGQPIGSNEFLASTTAQDKYINNMYDYYKKQGYTPQQIADIHNQGYKNSGNPGSNSYQNPDYVGNFDKNFKATTTPTFVPSFAR